MTQKNLAGIVCLIMALAYGVLLYGTDRTFGPLGDDFAFWNYTARFEGPLTQSRQMLDLDRNYDTAQARTIFRKQFAHDLPGFLQTHFPVPMNQPKTDLGRPAPPAGTPVGFFLETLVDGRVTLIARETQLDLPIADFGTLLDDPKLVHTTSFVLGVHDGKQFHPTALVSLGTDASFFITGQQRQYHFSPVFTIPLWFASEAFGTEPAPWAGASLMVHSINLILAFLVLSRLLADRFLAGLGTLLFALSPASAIGISTTMNLHTALETFFVLSALYALARGLKGKWFFIHIMATTVAIFTKETAMTVAVVTGLYWLLVARTRTVFVAMLLDGAVCGLMLWIRSVCCHPLVAGAKVGPLEYLKTQLGATPGGLLFGSDGLLNLILFVALIPLTIRLIAFLKATPAWRSRSLFLLLAGAAALLPVVVGGTEPNSRYIYPYAALHCGLLAFVLTRLIQVVSARPLARLVCVAVALLLLGRMGFASYRFGTQVLNDQRTLTAQMTQALTTLQQQADTLGYAPQTVRLIDMPGFARRQGETWVTDRRVFLGKLYLIWDSTLRTDSRLNILFDSSGPTQFDSNGLIYETGAARRSRSIQTDLTLRWNFKTGDFERID